MRIAERGMSLIELIMAIVVASAGIAVITHGFMTASRGIRTDEEIQTATRHAHDCAEHILGRRRSAGGFSVVAAASPSTLCDALTLTSGYSRSVVISDVTLAQSAACPSTLTGDCRRIDVTVAGPDGYQAAVNFLITNY